MTSSILLGHRYAIGNAKERKETLRDNTPLFPLTGRKMVGSAKRAFIRGAILKSTSGKQKLRRI